MRRIGVDLDEILSDTLSSFLEYYNKLHKTSFKRDDFHTYNYWEVLGGTVEEAVGSVRGHSKDDSFINMRPIAGAYKALLQLKKLGYELCIITGRSIEYKKQTMEWVNKNYPDIFFDIFFASTLDVINKKKSDICKSLDITIFIEDDPYHIVDCTNAGIKVLVLDCPWNKGKDFKNSIRVYSWKEIIEKIKDLSI